VRVGGCLDVRWLGDCLEGSRIRGLHGILPLGDSLESLAIQRFDGIGFNEHHPSPYGLMTSPNLMAAAASQRTHRMKLLIYGDLLPIHDPLRLAEELAMLDCLSNGRLISGFARGIPREYVAYGVELAESRARFEEAWEIIKLAWTEEVFSYHWSAANDWRGAHPSKCVIP
jgi:alkanesulfonate monooxygenase SsuD/methylene tetrahydromethanopterin reductase-like flavin-dependent oxidoreductase (luciferase family)